MTDRTRLFAALVAMPDEAFDWFVLAALGEPTPGLSAQIWPASINGFSPASQAAIGALRAAAAAYVSASTGQTAKEEAPMENVSEISARLELVERESGERLLKFFHFKHLPNGRLQQVSAGFARLASDVVADTASSAERSAGLRKLLEAKDCIVRANLE
jgi:hypothetical protein